MRCIQRYFEGLVEGGDEDNILIYNYLEYFFLLNFRIPYCCVYFFVIPIKYVGIYYIISILYIDVVFLPDLLFNYMSGVFNFYEF